MKGILIVKKKVGGKKLSRGENKLKEKNKLVSILLI